MASLFDLSASINRARKQQRRRKRRSDAGVPRIPAAVARELRALLRGDEYPGVPQIVASLERKGLTAPSRATIYAFMQRQPGPSYKMSSLPAPAQAALYNLAPGDEPGTVPGAQLAFYCFNYGDLAAVHFAAGLPWLALHHAYRLRGWRPASRGLLRAVLLARRIPDG